jgi:hypothetical protein
MNGMEFKCEQKDMEFEIDNLSVKERKHELVTNTEFDQGDWSKDQKWTKDKSEVGEDTKALLHQFGVAFTLLSEALGGDFNQITPAGEPAMDVVNRMLDDWADKFASNDGQ